MIKPVKYFLAVFLFASFTASCQKQIAVDDIDNKPVFKEEDKKHADVFKILDGTWKGKFLIYQDEALKPRHEKELENISHATILESKLKLINSIDVTQVYTSESPYFQRVLITDYYPDSGKKEVSKGVNKIQDGNVWCIVKKPDDTVIHTGKLEGENTIIWSRDEKTPQRIEYFKETVSAETYEIVGWGYYVGDNPSLSPKLWFYAKYERQ